MNSRQGLRALCGLSFGGVLWGCSQPPERVYVDLNLVPLKAPFAKKESATKTASLIGGGPTTKSVPGRAAKVIRTDRTQERQRLKARLDQESNEAIRVISERLKQYYQRDIDDFYTTELAKLEPLNSELVKKFVADSRAIFEQYADKRAQPVVRLTFLTEFPNPKQLIPLDEPDLSASEVAKRTEIRDLQRKIAKLDADYEASMEALENSLRDKLGDVIESLNDKLEAKREEINRRSLNEASQQVRRFSELINARLFAVNEIKFEAVSSKEVRIPGVSAPPSLTVVTSGGSTGESRDDLKQQLDIWLQLMRYERSDRANGARDVTTEFVKWRRNLNNGRLGDLRKSSERR